MLSIKNKWFLKAFMAGLLVITIVTVGGFMVYAQKNIDSETSTRVKETLSKITQNQFGEILVKKSVDFNGQKHIIAEDNKYIYKVTANSGELAVVIAKDYDDKVKIKDVASSDELLPIADKYLDKYCHHSVESKYNMVDYQYKDTDNEKYHDFIYHEVASNGIKTGWGVSISLNNAGELVALAVHEGNTKVAQEVKSQLSRGDAVKIAIDFIKKAQPIFKDVEKFPKDQSELTVWKDILVWSVKINEIKAGGFIYGFDFKIDAVTGEILFNDYYSRLD